MKFLKPVLLFLLGCSAGMLLVFFCMSYYGDEVVSKSLILGTFWYFSALCVCVIAALFICKPFPPMED